jgi:hypothetical protein
MEKQTLSMALKSRIDYELIAHYLDAKRWSRESQIVWGFIQDYYARDRAANSIDRAVIGEIIAGSVHNDKHVDKFLALIDEAYGVEVSGANVREAILLAKRDELAQALAIAIANGKEHEALLEEYNNVLKQESLEDKADSGIEVFTAEDMEALLNDELDPTSRLPVYPKALGERLGGGLRGADKLTLIARPEMGKTALILTMACGFARAGFPGVIFNNEERIQRLYIRAISNMTGMTGHEVRQDVRRAREIAMERGFGNLRFVAMSPGRPKQIDAELERAEDARWFVVDQLRNLIMKSDNKVNQLEDAAKAIRDIGKARDLATIDVTQAGDSASGKSVLDMGDVDNSNTGIPGACDALLGVGANEQQMEQGIRVLTLIKNKIGEGNHESFPTRINPFISKYVSI